jgi:2-alkenal reductase
MIIAALILGGCSANGFNSEEISTATPLNGLATLTTTTIPGDITTTPEMMSTVDITAIPEALTTTATVDAMATPGPTSEVVIPDTGGVTVTGNLVTLQSSYEQIYNLVNPSVVYIEVDSGSAFPDSTGSGSRRGSGSGFVWDTQGHIVTNNHVITGATTVNVTFVDGTTATAKVIGQDPNADLAVLQVAVSSSVLHPVTMGDSTKVRVGQIAIAIGNPFGLAGSMSEGIISALARSLPVESSNQNGSNPMNGVYNIPNIIQTDAAINPGNSGGVLVNLQGEVIGLTAAIASQSQSNSGIGFVIPSEIVIKVVPDLISTGKYAHPWLGVTGLSMTPDVASKINLPATQRGALIIAVSPGGPAAAAGLQPSSFDNSTGSITTIGDIITATNGQPVRVFDDLGSYLFMHTKPGDVVTLTVLRDGKEQTVKITLGTLPTP